MGKLRRMRIWWEGAPRSLRRPRDAPGRGGRGVGAEGGCA